MGSSTLPFVMSLPLFFGVVTCGELDSGASRNRTAMKTQNPADFFDGSALDLARAIDSGNNGEISRLIPVVKINQVHRRGMTLLFYALMAKKYAVVKELIKAGADPTQKDEDLGSPLDIAVRMNESDALAAMLDAGVSPDSHNSWATPLLFTAACLDSTANLKLLLDRHADINATDKHLGRTAVYEALSKRCFANAIYLVEKGAKVDITTSNGVTLAYSVEWEMAHQKPGTPEHQYLARLKAMMEERGVKFPAETPQAVRARLKSKR